MSASFGTRSTANYLFDDTGAGTAADLDYAYPLAWMVWTSRTAAANATPAHETAVHFMNTAETAKRFMSCWYFTDHTGRYVQCDDTGANTALTSINSGDTDGTYPIDGTWTMTLVVETNATTRTIYYGSKGGTLRSKSGGTSDIGSDCLFRFVAIGGQVYGNQDNWGSGKIARVALWATGTALNSSDAGNLFAGAEPSTVGTLKHYWPLNDNAGSLVLTDSVGSWTLTKFGTVNSSNDEPFTSGSAGRRMLLMGVG